jgi:hypothetical protein
MGTLFGGARQSARTKKGLVAANNHRKGLIGIVEPENQRSKRLSSRSHSLKVGNG